jgi:hypothetical protein
VTGGAVRLPPAPAPARASVRARPPHARAATSKRTQRSIRHLIGDRHNWTADLPVDAGGGWWKTRGKVVERLGETA